MKITKVFGIIALICLATSFSSCKKENSCINCNYEEFVPNSERTDPCSGPGGSYISMTGNQIFQPGNPLFFLSYHIQ